MYFLRFRNVLSKYFLSFGLSPNDASQKFINISHISTLCRDRLSYSSKVTSLQAFTGSYGNYPLDLTPIAVSQLRACSCVNTFNSRGSLDMANENPGLSLPSNVNSETSQIAGFIWSIADEVLRDVYVRGKYRDVILPMIVLRRLDIVLESKKDEVLKQKKWLDEQKIVDQEQPLRAAAGQAFYNTSTFTLRDLASRTKTQQLRIDFEHYLDGFSKNVQDIITNFKFRNQVDTLSDANALGPLISKFIDPKLNLGGLDNHAMGSVYEELIRMFNEANNEEAGEHWTPRDVVKLMTEFIFTPVATTIPSGTYLLYDAAVGTGGMLTVADASLKQMALNYKKNISTHLYGQEINAETYAICKSDLLLSGEGEEADNIVGGPAWSTLSNDAFPHMKFDFMLSNPPYGKSWKTDLEKMSGNGKKVDLKDSRFIIDYAGDPAYSLVTRSSDGQLMFLANMISKMKHDTPIGSRIAEIHNGSSIFTGDAGQGESNIRRWIIENDWLEAIVQLPQGLFYNTPISTYVWILSSKKSTERQGKVQLIDASDLFTPLQKNLGNKNCELSAENQDKIMEMFSSMAVNSKSMIFNNEDFGYTRVKVNRPLRRRVALNTESVSSLRFNSGDILLRESLYTHFGDKIYSESFKLKDEFEEVFENEESQLVDFDISPSMRKRVCDQSKWLKDLTALKFGEEVLAKFGNQDFHDFNDFSDSLKEFLVAKKIKFSNSELKSILSMLSEPDDTANPVIKKVLKSDSNPDSIYGPFQVEQGGKKRVVEYEIDTDLSDYEQVPLSYPGGIDNYFRNEISPFFSDAWIEKESMTIGYEILFNKYFAKIKESRQIETISKEYKELEKSKDATFESVLGRGTKVEAKLKESGVAWLGEIPQHWELKPIKALLKPSKRTVGSKSQNYKLLSLTLKGIIERDLEGMKGKFPASFDTYQVVEPGDFVFCLFDIEETPRAVGLSKLNGMITGAYDVYKPVDERYSEYLYYLLLSIDMNKNFKSLYRGMRNVIQKATFNSILLPIPPLEELDDLVELAKESIHGIETSIELLEREIQILEEIRNNRTTAVTRGRAR